jgi:hypothetical protein
MKKFGPRPQGEKIPQETPGGMVERAQKTVWMTDLKKAGERAEYLWFKSRKKGVQGNG